MTQDSTFPYQYYILLKALVKASLQSSVLFLFLNNIYYEDIKTYIYINFHAINEPKIYNEDIYFKLLEYNWDFIFNIIEKNNKYYNK